MPTRILIVDDSPTQLALLRFVLDEAGMELVSATSAEEAWQAFQDNANLDLVITDIVMPGESGYDLCRRIKRSDRASVPVILLSTLSDPMDIIRGLECGADNFITKPYAPDQLLGRIKSVLANRRLRDNSRVQMGVEILFLGNQFTITSDKQQILDLLISTFEDIVRTNRGLQESKAELAAAKSQIESYARELEKRVAERTESLRQSNQTLSAIIDSSPVAIVPLDREMRVQSWNRPAEETFGWAPSEILQQPFQPVAPEAAQQFEALFRRSLAGEVLRDMPVRGQNREGKALDVEMSAAPLYDAEGAVSGVVQMLRDVTQRKILEMQLHHAQKIDAVGQLTGGIAHDFNNLLAVIIGNLELLDEGGMEPAEVKEFLTLALDAALRGAELTRQLLAFSRRQQLESKPLDINTLIRSTATLLARTLGESIRIDLHLDSELWQAFADASQVEAAVTNLAINARDAMPNGGTLTIETVNATLDEAYASSHPEVIAGDYVLLAVSDTGTGIPPEVLERVIEPFFTTKEVGKGTGLGLSMIYGFAKQSGGHLRIYSEVGHGTTVRLYLPKADRPADQSTGPEEQQLPRGFETILVVEDNPGVRRVVVKQLGDLGYQILEAENGPAALAILRQAKVVDLLFTDVVMAGGMSGVQLAEKARAEYPSLRVLFTSGFTHANAGNGTSARLDGHLLSKPYRRQDLAHKVRAVLSAPPGG